MPQMPRVQRIVLPILRDALTQYPGLKIGSWVEDIDQRDFPMINVRRVGGLPNPDQPLILGGPVIEMTVYATEDLPSTEDLYQDALEALFNAWWKQKVTDFGSLSSVKETMGMTQFDSPFMDSWRVQGLIQLGTRVLRRNRS
jgi:hypothetical protein